MRYDREEPLRDEPAGRLKAALEGLSSIQRDIILAALTGDDECLDEEIADRHGTSTSAVRLERILARRRLNETIFRKPEQEA